MSQSVLSESIRLECAAIAEEAGCELLDARFKGSVLRLVLDRAGGVTLDDCQTVSKQVSALLDVEDFGPGRYVLEVTSPGLDRQFYREQDYERFSGQRVRVTWKNSEMEHKKTVVGTLSTYSPERREIAVEASEGLGTYTISLENILLARLEPEI
jgi:ribosome maturation factor RimP